MKLSQLFRKLEGQYSKLVHTPKWYRRKHDKDYKTIQGLCAGKAVVKRDFRCEIGDHPETYQEMQCGFIAKWINHCKPKTILDFGSYRQFIYGMLSNYKVTTIDVRKRNPRHPNETVITCNAKDLNIKEKFDCITSTSVIEHCGLARYGDELDLDADKTIMRKLIDRLNDGGYLIFTTTFIEGNKMVINFNSPSNVYNGSIAYNVSWSIIAGRMYNQSYW